MATDPLGTVHAYMSKANEFLTDAFFHMQEATFLAALPPPDTESALTSRFERIQEEMIQANSEQKKYLMLKEEISTNIPPNENKVAKIIVFSKSNNLNNLNNLYLNSIESLSALLEKNRQTCINAGLFRNNPRDMPKINIYARKEPSSAEISEIATTILKTSFNTFSKIVSTCFSFVRRTSYKYIGRKETNTIATALLMASIGIPILYMELSKKYS